MGRPGGQGERQVCPSGSMATFDEPSDDQKGTTLLLGAIVLIGMKYEL